MTYGLPGSGKTTWAMEEVRKSNGRIKRVNMDSLRTMIDSGLYSKDRETSIFEVRHFIINYYLNKGYSVIVDDTNLNPKQKALMEIVIKDWEEKNNKKVALEIKDFSHVPVYECIKNDLGRREMVGSKVIYKMYDEYLKKKATRVPHNDGRPSAIICDIDGTLAHGIDNGLRKPYEWDKVGGDELDVVVSDMLARYAMDNYEIILVSGRDSVCRPQTEEWLGRNYVYYDSLFMRPQDDNRDDTVIKKEIYEKEIKGKYNIHLVLDDRQRVVDMWRGLGLKVLQVEEGYF